MNRQEIAQLLTVASGFDRRTVDKVTVEAWALVPGIRDAVYTDAVTAVVAHMTGPRQHEYLTVGHVVTATQVASRLSKDLVAADVRSARARKLVSPEWPEDVPVPVEVRDLLMAARETARDEVVPTMLEGSWNET